MRSSVISDFSPARLHLDAHGAHVDLVDLVQERQRQAAAGDHDALAAEAGAHEGDVARGLAIEAVEKQHRDRDHRDRDGDAEQPAKDDHGPHLVAHPENYLKSEVSVFGCQ